MRTAQCNRIAWSFPVSLMGLLLVAVVLGHDTLMASEAFAMPQDTARMEMSAHHPLAVEGLPPAEHPDNCGVSQSALLPSDGTTSLVLAPMIGVSVTPQSLLAGSRAYSLVWQEPHWPPGRLRSLIQVYRI